MIFLETRLRMLCDRSSSLISGFGVRCLSVLVDGTVGSLFSVPLLTSSLDAADDEVVMGHFESAPDDVEVGSVLVIE